MTQTITRKKLHVLLWCMLSLMLISVSSFGQSKRVVGRVIASDDAKPIPGATVQVKGTAKGVSTNINGEYSIETASGEVLVFKSLGYQTIEKVVGTEDAINVTLSVETNKLNEVVVVGYGTAKRGDITGSISSISAEDIRQTVSTTFDQAIQGRVPGVVVTSNSGQPGGGTSVQIRGVSTLGNAEPLYVVDGVFYGGDVNSRIYTGGSPTTNPLASLNPSDIESIDVLKDASATAIYGSRGSNGVIIVTTKKGQVGTPKVNFDAAYGIQQLPGYVPVMNLQEFATFRNERAKVYQFGATAEFADPSVLGPGTDWQKEIFRNAPQQNYNLSISGGDQRTTYLLSGGYFDQEGIATNSDFKRYSARLNLDNKTTKWLKIGTSLSLSRISENINNQDGNLINFAIRQSPDIPVRNPDGSYGGPYDPNFPLPQGNPLAIAEITLNQRKRNEIFGNAYADITFLKDFTLRNEISGYYNNGNIYQFTPTYQFGVTSNSVSTASRGATAASGLTARTYLTYVHTFANKYNVNATAGHEASSNVFEYTNASTANLLTNNISELNQGDANRTTATSGKGDNAIESYFVRGNFTYNNRYVLTATVRNDGSSNFIEGKKWNLNTAYGLAWKISEEGFLKDQSLISDLKLRLGYGTLNNQNTSSYAYGTKFTPVQTGSFGTTLLISNLQNPDVSWEKTKASNVGLDAGFFKGRLQFTLDGYIKNTDGLLQSLPLALFSGTTAGDYTPGKLDAPVYNLGSIRNKGLEFSINTVNIKSKTFTWKTDVTLSANRNKVTGLVTNNTIIPTYIGTTVISQTSVGHSIGEFYGYDVIGVFKNAEDLNNSARPVGTGGVIAPVGVNGVWVGDLKFRDVVADGIIDEKDRIYLGSPIPKFQFGFNNTFNYKGFDLTVFFNGNYGNKIFNNTKRENEDPRGNYGLLKSVADFARIGLIDPAGSATDVNNVYLLNEGTTIPRVSTADINNNSRPSDRFVEDGSYLRLKNLVVGYALPWSFINRAKFSYARVYANVQNVFTITNYSGYDPEVGSRNQSALSAGIDYGRYPSQRTFTFGINAGF